MGGIEFTAKLKSEGPGGALTFVYLPKEATAELRAKGRVSVVGRSTASRSARPSSPRGTAATR